MTDTEWKVNAAALAEKVSEDLTDPIWAAAVAATPSVMTEAGPTELWAEVERAYRSWRDWGRPTWQRFGLTVTRDAQRWWLDEPGNVIHQDQ